MRLALRKIEAVRHSASRRLRKVLIVARCSCSVGASSEPVPQSSGLNHHEDQRVPPRPPLGVSSGSYVSLGCCVCVSGESIRRIY